MYLEKSVVTSWREYKTRWRPFPTAWVRSANQITRLDNKEIQNINKRPQRVLDEGGPLNSQISLYRDLLVLDCPATKSGARLPSRPICAWTKHGHLCYLLPGKDITICIWMLSSTLGLTKMSEITYTATFPLFQVRSIYEARHLLQLKWSDATTLKTINLPKTKVC